MLQPNELCRLERARPNPSACWPHVEDCEPRHKGMPAHLLLQTPTGIETRLSRLTGGSWQVKLTSSDDQSFEVSYDVATESDTIKSTLEGILTRLHPTNVWHVQRVFPFNRDQDPLV